MNAGCESARPLPGRRRRTWRVPILRLALVAVLATVPSLVGCSQRDAAPTAALPAGERELILATTTSTQDSGLLDVLIPPFEAQTGYRVKPIAVGSGQAMALGERGEADVLLVHAPASERRFVAAGHGINRRRVMYNDFVLVGPPHDPAAVRGVARAADALARIAAAQALFISRGDNSGTDQLEKGLWPNGPPAGQPWYQETGQGMGATLNVAAEKGAYTLTDRATYLATAGRVGPILVDGDPALRNIYHVVQVNPAKSAKINRAGAEAFVAFLLAPATQAVIAEFGLAQYGQPLFFSDPGDGE